MKKLFNLFLVLFLALSFSCGGDKGEEGLNLTAAQKAELSTVVYGAFAICMLIQEDGDASACDSFEVIGEDPPESIDYENCVVTDVYDDGSVDCGNLTISSSLTVDSNSNTSGEVSFSHTSLFPDEITCDINIDYSTNEEDVTFIGTFCGEDINFTVEDGLGSNILESSDICSIEVQ